MVLSVLPNQLDIGMTLITIKSNFKVLKFIPQNEIHNIISKSIHLPLSITRGADEFRTFFGYVWIGSGTVLISLSSKVAILYEQSFKESQC